MERATVEVYERMADAYTRTRPPVHRERAQALAGAALAGLPVADLGCGPGGYGPDLAVAGHPVVGLDAAAAMVSLARGPERVVRADLLALPLRRRSVGGAWARHAYLHLAPELLPLALAHLHHALAVGAPLTMSMVPGGAVVSADDLPGRAFYGWDPHHLGRVVAGAGFEEVTVEEVPVGEAARSGRAGAGGATLWVSARRGRTLPDVVGPGMRLLVCGLNPSEVAADAGYGYASPSNRFWPAAVAAGLVGRPRDPWWALAVDRVGMTDLVKRATPRAGVLRAGEYRAGAERVARLAAWLRPAAVCVVGLAGWRAAVDRRAVPGWQPGGLGSVPAYVMPSTSGLNAHATVADLVHHLRAALAGPGSGRR